VNVSLYFIGSLSFGLLVGYGVALTLYGFGKFLAARRTRRDRRQWLGFLVVSYGALFLDLIYSSPISLATIPFAYLVCVRYWVNDQEFMKMYFPSWLVRRERAVLPVSDTTNNS
jgi:hypothetical protein